MVVNNCSFGLFGGYIASVGNLVKTDANACEVLKKWQNCSEEFNNKCNIQWIKGCTRK
jgi:hypothetical protein